MATADKLTSLRRSRGYYNGRFTVVWTSTNNPVVRQNPIYYSSRNIWTKLEFEAIQHELEDLDEEEHARFPENKN